MQERLICIFPSFYCPISHEAEKVHFPTASAILILPLLHSSASAGNTSTHCANTDTLMVSFFMMENYTHLSASQGDASIQFSAIHNILAFTECFTRGLLIAHTYCKGSNKQNIFESSLYLCLLLTKPRQCQRALKSAGAEDFIAQAGVPPAPQLLDETVIGAHILQPPYPQNTSVRMGQQIQRDGPEAAPRPPATVSYIWQSQLWASSAGQRILR